MADRSFEPTRFYNCFGGAHEPALVLRSGDSVRTRTLDSHGFDERGQERASRPNPLTGPFLIEGAEAGDVLAVRLEELEPNRADAWSRRYLAENVVDPSFARRLPEQAEGQAYARWRIDRASRRLHLVEPAGTLALPLAPMLGCIGTAPLEGQALSSATSGPHGGNMDYPGVAAGATLYLPVFVAGARLYVGDGHATQGDGEISGSGTEVSFDVRFTVALQKGRGIRWPRGENADWLFTLGNARPLEQALQHATTEMVRWLQEEWGLDDGDIGLLLGQAGRYEVGNVFDPAYTMACKVPKWSLRQS